MGAVGIVVGPGRDQLDRIRPEDGQIADIALPLRQVPGVVRIRLGAIAQLVAAERELRRRGQVERPWQRHMARTHAQLSQEPADAEEDAAGVIAGDQHRRGAPSVVQRTDPEALPGIPGRRLVREVLADRAHIRPEETIRSDRDDRHRTARPSERHFPVDPRPRPHLLDQQPNRLVLGARHPVRDDDHRTAQIELAPTARPGLPAMPRKMIPAAVIDGNTLIPGIFGASRPSPSGSVTTSGHRSVGLARPVRPTAPRVMMTHRVGPAKPSTGRNSRTPTKLLTND